MDDQLQQGSNPPSITTGAVSQEQIRYWDKDLGYKKWSLRVSILGFALVSLGLLLNYCESGKVTKSVRANVQHGMVTQVTNLDRIFVEKPELRPYFYDSQEIDQKDPRKYQQVLATVLSG